MTCTTCQGKGYYIPDEAWNQTLQEFEQCPDCKKDPKTIERPKTSPGLLT